MDCSRSADARLTLHIRECGWPGPRRRSYSMSTSRMPFSASANRSRDSRFAEWLRRQASEAPCDSPYLEVSMASAAWNSGSALTGCPALRRAIPRSTCASSVARESVPRASAHARRTSRMQDVRRACADALGTDSLATLDAQVLLGIALRSAGQPVRAEPEFQAALAMLTSRYGESHGASLACRLSHSANLLSLDRFAEAEKGIRDVLMEYERRLGPGHPHSLMCSVNLASALRLQSMQAQAMDAIGTA